MSTAPTSGHDLLEDKVCGPLSFAAQTISVKPVDPNLFDRTDALKSGIIISGDCLLGIAGATLKIVAGDGGTVASLCGTDGTSSDLPVKTKSDDARGVQRHNLQLPDGSHLQITDLKVGQVFIDRSNDPEFFSNSLGANMWWNGSSFDTRQVSVSANGVGAIAILNDPHTTEQSACIVSNTREAGQNVQRKAEPLSVKAVFRDSGDEVGETLETTLANLNQTADQALAPNQAFFTPRGGI